MTRRAPGRLGRGATYRGAVSKDRYGPDVLGTDWRATPAEATPGLVVEEVMTGWCGEVVSVNRDLDVLTLEDRRGRRRTFPLGPGFLLEGRPVVLTAPVTRPVPAAPRRTASGSVAVTGQRARVARESRIFVEGRHDAELVDHLVAGSKESRIADAVRSSPVGAHVLVVGHPFVDVWAAVRPERLGLSAWPFVPRDVEWKHGICAALGWPHADQADGGARLAADPRPGVVLRRLRAGPARAGRGADRLRHRELTGSRRRKS